MITMQTYGYIASVFMGLSLGLIGGGGSILTVPILVYLFLVDPMTATSSSLFIVGSTALVGAVLAYLRNDIDVKTGVLFFLPSFVGVFLTKSFLVPMIPETVFTFQNFIFTKPLLIMSLFAILMLMASLAMIRSKKKSIETSEEKFDPKQKHKHIQISVQGLVVGVVTGFVGAGGGFLIVPALVNLVGLNMRKAIGTSLMIIAANSLFGFTISISKGLVVNWNFLVSILSMALVGLITGSFFSKKVPEQKLKMGFGYFVLAMGTFVLWDQIKKL